MKQFRKRFLAIIACAAMVVSMLPQVGTVYAADDTEYQIYPTPHEMTYDDGDYTLNDINVIYDSEIDDATKERLEETAELLDLQVNEASEAVAGKTNVYVGVYGTDGTASSYIEDNYTIDSSLFEETDAHFVASNDGEIVVLGKDTDASYYGLTTLYHVFTQVTDNTIRNFTVHDWADVESRGFIEGYYGNPWSTEDRCNLMEWGGYYKLNSYFYAPKDDPKHNSNWRALYTDEEIETKIKPLAEAGNNSKCRFVYALHPYMYNAIDYSSEASYQADLKVMQDKFEQVIEAGVRQIAILADDAANVGSANYIKTLEDMTEWLEKMQNTYPDLKTTLPFVTQEYMYYGQSYYQNFPENVQIVMTGGRVWGEVSNSFTTTFTNNAGRGPYMWINWPCTDNSKKHLIMGGYSTFLQPGVDPSNIQGIVLNPMQQSEPSKVAIFGNACYSWNIWESEEEADAAWDASFSYVDHNSAIANDASNALRELSKHMINQNMDSRVTALQESVELSTKLDAFAAKLDAGTVTADDVDEIIAEFEVLQQAAVTYRAEAGDTNVRDQIVYWLDCWDDTTEAVISYLNAEKALINGEDDAVIWDYYANGQAAYESSKTHGFHYVDHTEYAEVGVQHIVPFMEKLDEVLSEKAAVIVDPTKGAVTKITGTGIYNTENMVIRNGNVGLFTDEDKSNYAGFAHSAEEVDKKDYTLVDAWVGLEFAKTETISSVKVTQGSGDHIDNGTLEYLNESDEWVEIGSYTGIGEVFEETFAPVQAKAIRLVNDTEKAIWWRIYEFEVNVEEAETGAQINATAFDAGTGVYAGSLANVVDGDTSTYLWYNTSGAAGQYIGVDLGTNVNLGRIYFLMDSGDYWTNYELQYSTNGANYITYNTYNTSELDVDLSSSNIEARYIRFYSTGATSTWTKFYEISVSESNAKTVYTNSADLAGIGADIRTSIATMASAGEITLAASEYIGLDLGRIKDLAAITVAEQGGLTLQVSKNEVDWTTVTAGTVTEDARYVRLINETGNDVTVNLTQFEVTSNEVAAPSLYETTMGINNSWGVAEDCRNNGAAFDGDVDTMTEFGDLPQEGQYIIYDLGQEREISKLEIFCQDSAVNYIRDAEISISNDLENWTNVITIGDGVENTSDANVTCINSDAGYSQTTSEYPNKVSIEGEVEPTTARYIKILMTATNNNRAVVFNEIAINDGEYVPVSNDPTFDSNVIEVQGHVPQNMVDGDLTTSYKPDTTEAGYIQYTLSDNLEVNRINIVQKGEISNAKVWLYVEQDGERSWVEAGTLDKSLNQIYCNYDLILEMKIEWEDGSVPTITEIVRFYEEGAVRTGLEKYIESLDVNAAEYTSASYAEFAAKLEAAQAALDNATSTEAELQNVWDELKLAYAGLVKKGNTQLIQDELDKIAGLKEADYTEETWSHLQAAVDAAKASMADEMTEAEVAEAVEELQVAQTNLVTKAEAGKADLQAYIDDNELESLDTSLYLSEGAKVFKDALAEAKAVIADNDAAVEEIATAKTKLQEARAGLVLKATKSEVDALKALADSYKEDAYTTTSWVEFKAVLDEVYAAIEENESTSDQVAVLKASLEDAAKDLVRRTDTSELDELLDILAGYDAEKYTEETYKVLKDAVAKAETALKNPDITETEVDALIEELMEAIDQLAAVKKPADAGSNSSGSTTPDGETTSPNTADSSMTVLWLVAAVLSMVVIIAKKRRCEA